MTQIDKNHPVRVILDSAAYLGNLPTRAQLDALDTHDLPDGQTLGRFRASVNRAASDVVAAKANGYEPARSIADREFDIIAARMTPEEAALSGEADSEPMQTITDRMFNN